MYLSTAAQNANGKVGKCTVHSAVAVPETKNKAHNLGQTHITTLMFGTIFLFHEDFTTTGDLHVSLFFCGDVDVRYYLKTNHFGQLVFFLACDVLGQVGNLKVTIAHLNFSSTKTSFCSFSCLVDVESESTSIAHVNVGC